MPSIHLTLPLSYNLMSSYRFPTNSNLLYIQNNRMNLTSNISVGRDGKNN
jgi:hypothetical protein